MLKLASAFFCFAAENRISEESGFDTGLAADQVVKDTGVYAANPYSTSVAPLVECGNNAGGIIAGGIILES